MKLVVVGSGPSAVAAATALVNSEHHVEMLDFGNKLESPAEQLAARIKTHPITEADLSILKKGLQDGGDHGGSTHKNQILALIKLIFGSKPSPDLNKKKQFGSVFPYKDIDEYIPLTKYGLQIPRSLAKGGLSNVWGAACYPLTKEDFHGWPISKDEMDQHYLAASDILQLDEKNDPLSDLYPVYKPKETNIQLNPQALDVFKKWCQSRERLNKSGFVFGQSRLAVLTHEYLGRSACQYCGLCLYGCPHDSIYNSAFTLDELRKNRNFGYRSGLFLKRFKELENGKISVEVEEVKSKKTFQIEYDKVFLGAGTLSTLRIVCDSLSRYPSNIPILDNDVFLLPLVKMSDWRDFDKNVKFTLSQLVLVIRNPAICSETIHTQLYSYNDYIFERFSPVVDLFPGIVRRKLNKLMYNMFIMFGYLHSKYSARINAKVMPSSGERVGSIDVDFNENPHHKTIIRNLLRDLSHNKKELDLYPLRVGLKNTEPGFSGHLAGSLPMRKNPRDFETHSDGRLYGSRCVYIIDQSTFPTLPAQNVTYSAMANAHRIAVQFLKNSI